MARIEKAGDHRKPRDDKPGGEHGVHPDVAKQESHGGYGGTDRLRSETGPLHDESGKDPGKDI